MAPLEPHFDAVYFNWVLYGANGCRTHALATAYVAHFQFKSEANFKRRAARSASANQAVAAGLSAGPRSYVIVRPVPKATLILHRKRRYDDGAILELKLWQVPIAVPGSGHRFKCSLSYGNGGQRLIGYDNEAESWENLASVMTGERYRLLQHLHAHPEPSVSAMGCHQKVYRR